MRSKQPPSERTGPMGMQPVAHGPSVPTQMLPTMPCAREEAEGNTIAPASVKRIRTRAEAVRAAMARIARRKSLRKQREAQKG